jgi:hypothetical protein
MSRKRRLRDAACVLNADGTLSNVELHEQMTAGVDDSDFRLRTRLFLLAKGIPAKDLNGLFPDLPPLPPAHEHRHRVRTRRRGEY